MFKKIDPFLEGRSNSIGDETILQPFHTRIKEMVDDLQSKGVSSDKIYFLGFSLGACLTLEIVTRNTKKYGG